MKRMISILICLFFLNPSNLKGVTLKKSIVVDGPQVKLSDIFEGFDLEKDRVLFPAPKPGKKYTFKYKRILRLAQRYKLALDPKSKIHRVIIRANSDTIEEAEILDRLKEAFAKDLSGESYKIELDQKKITLHFPKQGNGNIRIDQIRFNQAKSRFQVKIIRLENGEDMGYERLSGRIIPVSSIPVLRQAIPKGAIISASDIEWVEISAHRINTTMIVDEIDLIGATPRRGTLRSQAPLQKTDITFPKIIQKGEAVIISAQAPHMMLTAKGKALEHGIQNTMIKVMNIDSKRIIQATVVGPKQVTVDVPTMMTISRG